MSCLSVLILEVLKVVMDRLLSASPSSHFDVCYCVPASALSITVKLGLPSLHGTVAQQPLYASVATILVNKKFKFRTLCEILLRTSNVRHMITLEILSEVPIKKNCRGTKIFVVDTFEKLFLDFLLDYEN